MRWKVPMVLSTGGPVVRVATARPKGIAAGTLLRFTRSGYVCALSVPTPNRRRRLPAGVAVGKPERVSDG